MMLIEDFKKDINNSLDEIKKHKQTSEGTEQNHPGSKMEVETIKKSQRETDIFGVTKPWKKFRSHRCKYQQQNTRDRRKNLRC